LGRKGNYKKRDSPNRDSPPKKIKLRKKGTVPDISKKRICPPIKLKKQIIKLRKVLLCYNLKEVM